MLVGVGGLDGVDDKDSGVDALYLIEHLREVGFGEEEEFFGLQTEPISAHFDLPRGFLAADVKDTPDGLGEQGANLVEEGGFADAGFATEQDDAAGDDATTEDTVEFFDRDKQTLTDIGADFAEALGGAGSRRGATARSGRRLATDRFDFFDHGVELTAVGTAAKALGGLVAAVGANVFGA